MDNLIELASSYVLPVAVATVGAMYLDAKHHIVKDIAAWRACRQFQQAMAETEQLMGDYCTLYHALELNDPMAEAFWFEGRTWTFAEVGREADKLAQWYLDQGIRTKGANA
jgi:hypothetical protein